jgi:hypothetical protein
MHSVNNRWTFTRRFAQKKGQSRFLVRLDEARSYFPELEGTTVKLGITVNADGKADLQGKGVYFRSRNVSFYVMGHELTHLLQDTGDVPKGERSCDVFTRARGALFCDEAPNYVSIPKEMVDKKGTIKEDYKVLVHGTARVAVNLKNSGERRYIQWFEKTLEEVMLQEDRTAHEDFESPEWVIREEKVQTRIEEFY